MEDTYSAFLATNRLFVRSDDDTPSPKPTADDLARWARISKLMEGVEVTQIRRQLNSSQ